MKHYWEYCDVCERDVVICGKCGNNTCNGGSGTLPDGSVCDMCPDAYELSGDAKALLLRAWDVWAKELERALDKVFYPNWTDV